MTDLRVELGERSYAVSVGHGLAARLDALLQSFARRRVVLVCDARVRTLHGQVVERALRRLGRSTTLALPAGERHKTLRTLARLHDGFAAAGLARDGLVVACGGGVVGDVAGFAAATWMRGVDYVQVPTTLLAMVDSSVGGKVAVNHRAGKNLIGAFHQPRAVVADLELLRTLPPRELRSGAFEILKCGLIGDRALFEHMAAAPADLQNWDAAALEWAVAAAVRLKADVVAQDEREGGLRRVLNLGHTLGHALEAVTAYRRFTHGEAVGWGLLGAAWLARERGLVDAGQHAAIAAAVTHLGPRPRVDDLDARALLRALAFDKKARAGRVPFVLPEGLGRVRIAADVTPAEVRAALHALRRVQATRP